MSRLAKNIAANFVGSGWIALMGIIFIPVYIKFLGIDSYGLIGIYTSLQALFGLLDIGLSTTLNREMARLSGQTDKAGEMRDLVRTLEIIYWILGAAIAFAVILLAPLIANYWIQPGKLSTDTIQQAIMVMGLTIAFQFIFTFYSGGLLGLQKQILLNSIIYFNKYLEVCRSYLSIMVDFSIHPGIFHLANFNWNLGDYSSGPFFMAKPSLLRAACQLPNTTPSGDLAICRRHERYHHTGAYSHPNG